MNEGRLVFRQITDLIHHEQLDRCSRRYPMPRASRTFSVRDQFLAMAFAQITFRESLRDIEACLRGSRHLYAMGIRGNITRTNLAYANENRDWRVFADLAGLLMRKATRLYAEDPHGLAVEEIVYALDSTTIDLCLSMFPWATFRQGKSAIKIHTQMDLRGSIPVFIVVTEGLVHDVNILDMISVDAGSIYVVDRGYLDFERLYRIHTDKAYFVTRAKSNMAFYVRSSSPAKREEGLICDQLIGFKGYYAKLRYPERMCRIRFRDPESGEILTFLTNHFELDALTVASVYKSRWNIELFFKWIKQNLRIKAFYGTSENAVKTQIWIAICVYLMVACLKKTHEIKESLARILQVISVNVFQKDLVDQLLADSCNMNENNLFYNQLMFNDF